MSPARTGDNPSQMYWIAFIVPRSVPRQRGPGRRNAGSAPAALLWHRAGTSARRVGIAPLGPRALRSLILALPCAHFFEIGFPVFTTHLTGLIAICVSPLLIGLSGLLRIGGAPLTKALPAFLRVFVRHLSSRRGTVTGFQVRINAGWTRPVPKRCDDRQCNSRQYYSNCPRTMAVACATKRHD
jgi:hypothetical protein